ncbi:MAG: hypothetical protein CUN55_00310 [Phototrophicales bacterium]|nr:MAG: hypothetical protein CUN55_00310 [Phototrophicales bacterium]
MKRREPPLPKKKKYEDEEMPFVERCLWVLVGILSLVALSTLLLGAWLWLNRETPQVIPITATPTSIVQVVQDSTATPTPLTITPAPVTPLFTPTSTTGVFIAFSTSTPTSTPTLRPARVVTAAPFPSDLRIPGVDWRDDVIAVGRSYGVLIYNPLTLGASPRLFAMPTAEILNVALSADGARVVGAAGDGRLIVWRVLDGEIEVELPSGRLPIWAVTFSPDGRHILAGTDGGFVRMWSLDDMRETLFSALNESVHSVAFHPDGGQVVAGTYTGRILVWDVQTRSQSASLSDAHLGFVWALVYHPSGAFFASAGEDGRVVWWDATTFEPLLVLDELNETAINDLAFNATGTRLAAAGADGRVVVWDTVTRQVARVIQHPVGVTALSFSPDDDRLLTGALDGSLRVWWPDSDAPRTLPGR